MVLIVLRVRLGTLRRYMFLMVPSTLGTALAPGEAFVSAHWLVKPWSCSDCLHKLPAV